MSTTINVSGGGAAKPIRHRSRLKNQTAGQSVDPVWAAADESLTDGLLRTLSRSARNRLRFRRSRSADASVKGLSPA